MRSTGVLPSSTIVSRRPAIVRTGHPGARSFFWNKDNHFIKLDQPRFGSVAVFRDAPFTDSFWASGTGHVGFVVDWSDTSIELLGGNQGKTVQKKVFQRVYKNGTTTTRKIVAFMIPAMN